MYVTLTDKRSKDRQKSDHYNIEIKYLNFRSSVTQVSYFTFQMLGLSTEVEIPKETIDLL